MVEEGGGSKLAVELPESAVAWLDEQADAGEVTREEFLRQLVAALRNVDRNGPDPATGEGLEALTERVAALEDDVDAKIEDVRERVIQVKRETDSKAPADHDHPDLAEQVHAATETAESARSALADVEADLREFREATEGGFENYEEIVEYLTDTTDDLEEKLTRLAAALVVTRRAVDEVGAGEAGRSAVAEIKTAANRHGIGAADCEHCGENVDVGLLAEPACPHCGTPVRDIEPASGFFRSATLIEGEPSPPAAESGATAGDGPGAEEVAEALLEGESVSETGDGRATGDPGDEEPRATPDGNGVETEESVSDGDPDE